MSKTIYIQKGNTIDFVNETEKLIESGEIINLSTRIAIAGCDINPKETGTLHLTGIYEMPKNEDETIDFGRFVYLNSDGKITLETSEGKNVLAGLAVETSRGTTIKVRI